jgi:predicted dehydrogenase
VSERSIEGARPLRAGVVGFGWAGRQHMIGYSACADAELVAICGLEPDLGDDLADEFGVPDQYRSLDDLLAKAELDVVSIATPTAMHAPMAVRALDAGVHVLSEKPIAETAARAAEMVAAAERNDRVLDVSYNHRRRGVVTALKEAIDDGLLGHVYYAKAGWLRRRGIPGLGTWFTRKDSAGGGPFMDIGVHMADIVMHLLGEPGVVTVTASTYAEFGPRGLGGSARGAMAPTSSPYEVEDLATAFCRMDTGATVILEASWAQWVPHELCFVDLYGTEAGAHLEWGSPTSGDRGLLTIRTDVKGHAAEITPAIPTSGGHTACIADFVQIVRSGDWSGAHGGLSLSRAALIDAAYESAEQRREVVF